MGDGPELSPTLVRRDSKRSWGPYKETGIPSAGEISEETQERLARTVIEHLRSAQAGFEQRIASQPMIEQQKREMEHHLLIEQLQSLHVEQGGVNWDQKMVKEEIGKSARALISQQQWLYQRSESVSDKMDTQQSFMDTSMFGQDVHKNRHGVSTAPPPPATTSVHGTSVSDPTTHKNVHGAVNVQPTTTNPVHGTPLVGWSTNENVRMSETPNAGQSISHPNGGQNQTENGRMNQTNLLDSSPLNPKK